MRDTPPPPPEDMLAILRGLHDAYCARTGFDLRLNMARELSWQRWLAFSGFTWRVPDLARVIGYLRSEIKKGTRNAGALKFSNLIEQPDRFEEDHALATAAAKEWRGEKSPRTTTTTTTPPEAAEQATGSAYFLNQLKQELTP